MYIKVYDQCKWLYQAQKSISRNCFKNIETGKSYIFFNTISHLGTFLIKKWKTNVLHGFLCLTFVEGSNSVPLIYMHGRLQSLAFHFPLQVTVPECGQDIFYRWCGTICSSGMSSRCNINGNEGHRGNAVLESKTVLSLKAVMEMFCQCVYVCVEVI